MNRVPNGTHEYTDEFGVQHYTENLHRMWDIAILFNREQVDACEWIGKDDAQHIANACHRIGMSYWNADKVMTYYGNLIGNTGRSETYRERLATTMSLQKHVNNHRSKAGLNEVKF